MSNSRTSRLSSAGRLGLPAMLASLLAGCASLPSSGPTAGQIVSEERGEAQAIGFQITEISTEVLPPPEMTPEMSPERLTALTREGRVDLIGPGDVLQITLYEVGVTLFASNTTSFGSAAPVFDTSARAQAMPGVVVDLNGQISLPYVGRLMVAGRSTSEVARMVERGLAGKSQQPQVVVAIRDNVTNTVLVSGAVARPGRQPLTLARERLLDAIAHAGGTGDPEGPQNTLVRFTRDEQTVEIYLETIESGSPADLVLLPGDRIDLVRRPRTFTVFGATSRVSQVPFGSSAVSLNEAIARAGGPEDLRADPTAVFVFRYADDAGTEAAPRPIVYRLNMMKPSSYFLAQRFMMHDKDVIYIANAKSNQTRKLVEIINLLFSPVFNAERIARP